MNRATHYRKQAQKVRTLSLIPALGTVFLLSVFTVGLPTYAIGVETVRVAPAVAEKPYVINAASFQSKKVARALVDKLNSAGKMAYISRARVKGVTWYRVRVGFYKNASLAKAEAKRIAAVDKFTSSAWVSRAPLSELAPRTAEIKKAVVREVIRAPKRRIALAQKTVRPVTSKKDTPIAARKKKLPEPVAATNGRPVKTDAVPRRSYVVNVASLQSKRDAELLSKKLLSSGYKSYVSTAIVQGKRWYRVRIGFFDNREAAQKKVKAVSSSYDVASSAWVSKAPVSELKLVKKLSKPAVASTRGKVATSRSVKKGSVVKKSSASSTAASASAWAAVGATVGTAESTTIVAKTAAGAAAVGSSVVNTLKGVGSAVKSIPKSIRGVKKPETTKTITAKAATRTGSKRAKTLAVEEKPPKAGLLTRIGRTIKKPFSFLSSSRKKSNPALEEKKAVAVSKKSARKVRSNDDASLEKAPGGFMTTMTNVGLALPHTISGVGPISDRAELHGRMSIDDSYSFESNSTSARNFLTTRLRLNATNLNDAGTLSLHFGGRYRTQLSGQKYSSLVKPWQVDTFYMEYAPIKERLYLRAGRLTPKEGVGENVDGLNVLLKGKSYGVGAFAGTKPDPFTGGFDSKYTSSGGYVFYRRGQLFSNLSFVNNTFEGKVDRQYLSGNLSFSPIKKARVFGAFTSDVDQLNGGMSFTNGFVELSYRPTNNSSVAIGAREYRGIRLYESMDFYISTSRQNSFYARGSYRLLKKYSLTGKVEQRILVGDTPLIEDKVTTNYMLGISNGNILGSGVSGNFSTTYSDGYSSTYTLYSVRFMRQLVEKVDLTLNGSVMDNEYELTGETDTTLRYGASLNLRPGRSWNLSLSYDGTTRDEYSTTNINSRVSYRF